MNKFEEKFKEYQVDPATIGFRNIGWKYVFKNGYGASVIDDGYRTENKPYEVAVLEKIDKNKYGLCYDTPITDDVLGCLTDEEVCETLEKIKELSGEEDEIKIFGFRRSGIGYNNMSSIIEKLNKMINKMAEDLTTPIHDKEWIINHYLKEIEKDEN